MKEFDGIKRASVRVKFLVFNRAILIPKYIKYMQNR
jgi:hypothetical protein